MNISSPNDFRWTNFPPNAPIAPVTVLNRSSGPISGILKIYPGLVFLGWSWVVGCGETEQFLPRVQGDSRIFTCCAKLNMEHVLGSESSAESDYRIEKVLFASVLELGPILGTIELSGPLPVDQLSLFRE